MSPHSPYPQRRNDKRYRSKLPIRVRLGGRVVELVAEDMSFRGLFVATDDALPVRQLIQLDASLPPGNIPFAAHAMVVHVIPAGHPSGRPAGCGLQFYGMGDKRRVWDEYIRHLHGFAPQVPDDRIAPVQASQLPTPSAAIAPSSAPSPLPTGSGASGSGPRLAPPAPPIAGRRPPAPPPIPQLTADDLEILDGE